MLTRGAPGAARRARPRTDSSSPRARAKTPSKPRPPSGDRETSANDAASIASSSPSRARARAAPRSRENGLRAPLDRAAGPQHDLVAEVARGVHDVARVLERERAVAEERRVDRFGQHPAQMDRLAASSPRSRLNIASIRWPLKMSPVMCLVGGMYLSGASGKIWRASCACAT